MAERPIRTSVDIPESLYRRLHEAAARQGCSAHQLMLRGIEHAVQQTSQMRPKRRLKLDPPLVAPAGRTISLTNEQAYDLIKLP